jgi:hypothetical protein
MAQNERQVEPAVRLAARLWVLAVAAGLLETLLIVLQGQHHGADLVVGVLVRTIVVALALLAVRWLCTGSRAARLTLAVALAGLGSLSLLIGPVEWFAGGHSLGEAYRAADGWDLVFAGSRVVHVAAVWTATGLMFTPAANRWFSRTGRRRRASVTGVAMPGNRAGVP